MTEEDEKKEAEGKEVKGDAKKTEDEAKTAETKETGGEEGEDPIKKAEGILSKITGENDRREKILKEEKEFHAKKMLGGVTQAGQQTEEKVETPKEYKDRIMSGRA